MIHLSQRLNTVLFNQTLDLRTAFAGKGSVSLIRQVNGAGSGYSTFVPGSNFNSLNVVAAGSAADVVVDALPSGGVDLDNGVPATGSDPVVLTLDGSQPVAGETDYLTDQQAFPVATTGVPAYPSGSSLLSVSFNGGASFAEVPATGVALPAATYFVLKATHQAGAAFVATLTCTPT